jgi:O-antigen/teichoic acid export membrane protein
VDATGGEAAAGGKVRRVRNPLPYGTTAVGTGLLISGIAIYAFTAVASRHLGKEEYAPLLLLWYSIFLVGPGFFLPVEQELSRSLAARRSRREGGEPLVERASRLTLVMLGGLLVVTALLSPVLLDTIFDDQLLLLASFALGLIGVAVGFVARGVLSATGRFRSYALYVGSDGVLRLVLCLVVVAVGVDTAGWFGLAVAAAPFGALAVSMAGQRGLVEPGPPVVEGEFSRALAALLTASVLAFTLLNIGPLAIDFFGTPDEQAEASLFGNGVFVARVPLFLFQAVQAALLPKLSALAEQGRMDELRDGMKRLLALTAALGVVGTIGAFTIGPFVVSALFGEEYGLDARTLGLLAMSSAFYMLATAVGQAVIALSGHKLVALSWGLGVLAFGLVAMVAADDLFLRVEIGLVAGAAVATLAMALSLRARLRAGAVPDPGDVVEALHDLPLEP